MHHPQCQLYQIKLQTLYIIPIQGVSENADTFASPFRDIKSIKMYELIARSERILRGNLFATVFVTTHNVAFQHETKSQNSTILL